MNKSTFIFYFSILSTFLFSQNNQDARMLGLNGSYTTLAIGFQSIGINPANLSVYNQRSINLFNLALRFNNNSLSIANYNSINGANLEDSTSFSYLPKALFYETFEGDGLRLKQNLFFPFPIINFSTKKNCFYFKFIFKPRYWYPKWFFRFSFIWDSSWKFNIYRSEAGKYYYSRGCYISCS